MTLFLEILPFGYLTYGTLPIEIDDKHDDLPKNDDFPVLYVC